jgi:hypothetical protein
VLKSVAEFLKVESDEWYSDDEFLAWLKARLRKKGRTFLTSWSADKKHWEAWVKGHETQTGTSELAALMAAIGQMEDSKWQRNARMIVANGTIRRDMCLCLLLVLVSFSPSAASRQRIVRWGWERNFSPWKRRVNDILRRRNNVSWTGFYPFLWSSPGILGYTYLQGVEVAHNITLIILFGIGAAGLLYGLKGEGLWRRQNEYGCEPK